MIGDDTTFYDKYDGCIRIVIALLVNIFGALFTENLKRTQKDLSIKWCSNKCDEERQTISK